MSNTATPIKILIAEDNTVSRRLLEKRTTEWGYTVLTTGDGREAWDAFLANDVGIAILDWLMPEISGIELCRRIRNHPTGKYTYIILLTSKTEQDDVKEGFLAGADDYITKPFSHPELKARLNTGKRIIDLLAELHRIAIRDDLTRLLNRAEISRILKEELDRSLREAMPLGVIMLDIDNFKRVNDTYGHLVGDQVLIEISSRLRRDKRSYDKIGRFGGEEILIVLPNNTCECVHAVAERLRVLIGGCPIPTDAGDLTITASLGGACTETPDLNTPQALIEAADRALYKAKATGRNRSEVFAPPAKGEER